MIWWKMLWHNLRVTYIFFIRFSLRLHWSITSDNWKRIEYKKSRNLIGLIGLCRRKWNILSLLIELRVISSHQRNPLWRSLLFDDQLTVLIFKKLHFFAVLRFSGSLTSLGMRLRTVCRNLFGRWTSDYLISPETLVMPIIFVILVNFNRKNNFQIL